MRLTADTSGAEETLISLNAASDGNGILCLDGAAGKLALGIEGFTAGSFSTFTTTAAKSWVLLAAGKASGSATPRMHQYVYGTGVWTHQNGTVPMGDGSLGATVTCELGGYFNGFNALNGDLAVAAIFPGNLSDAAVETLLWSLMAWHSQTPLALWLLDQSATSQAVDDLTGGGATQTAITGTSVAATSVPGFSYGADTLGVHSYPTSGLPPPIEGGENSSTMYSRGFGKG